MNIGKLSDVTGKAVRDWCKWLADEQNGCCSLCFNADSTYRYCVCVGWCDDGNGWRIAWKIGRQTLHNAMQTDLDIDFEVPYSAESGEVDDTEEIIELGFDSLMKDWNALAARMRREARRVWKAWKED